MLAALALLLVQPKIDLGVVFSRPGGESLKMDIYHPVDESRPAPAVVVIHGGAWMMGERSDMASICKALATRGLLAATVDYRLVPKSRWPAFYDDAQTAVRYLRTNSANLNIRSDRIGACGASAGGHLALMLGFTETRNSLKGEYPGLSSRVQAILDIFGPTDMSRDYPKSYDNLFMAVLGKERKDAAAEIRAASPANFIDRMSAPVFIIHGLDDPIVPVAQSKWLESKLKAGGIKVEARYIAGMQHSVDSKATKALEEGLDWLKATLSK